jgi:hypothetical protein
LIGQVYRLRVTNIPLETGVEVYPTIELIDRVNPPAGMERRFAIPIDLDLDDLREAAAGKFVTRIVYVEDPNSALPTAQEKDRIQWFDVGPGQDPLAVADQMGRPVAIIRLGSRLPTGDPQADQNFCYGYPAYADYPPEPSCKSAGPRRLKGPGKKASSAAIDKKLDALSQMQP